MKKHYLFFSNHLSLKPDTAHEIHDVLCANAAANLGYSSVLTYPDQTLGRFNPIAWAAPFKLQKPDQEFTEFYDTQDYLQIAPLPLPWLSDRHSSKFTNSSTIVCKYYLPVHILSKTQLVHTRNWNFAKAAVKNEIPVIYESHYYQETPFEKAIVSSPWFQVAITQSALTRENLVQCGMPPEKAVALHNGFERSFLIRQPQEAETWRRELLKNGRNKLVVYSGALYRFKGVDLLIEVAKELPEIQFVVTGGTDSQVDAYRTLSQQKGVENITFLGWILPRQRLVSLFQAADILAHPHCSGKEADFTNPVKFFQYIASGTPIVATTIAPLLEFKLPHLAMDWCEPDDSIQFSDCLRFALKRYPRKIEGYAENIEFGQQFSWENRIEKILSYVDERLRPTPINLNE
ncbi:MAG: glycosyltransferase family 4 protein [Phormidesmis sp. CAN_BIN44]|nr:glycosyltransferase family 4 protein [Phormidesmis sp. CAN_BIN44]